MSKQIIYWTTVANPKGQKIPLYMRKAAYHPGEEEVYLPAAGVGIPEAIVQILAWGNGKEVLIESNHTYVAASWIKETWPKTGKTIERIEARILSEMKELGL